MAILAMTERGRDARGTAKSQDLTTPPGIGKMACFQGGTKNLPGPPPNSVARTVISRRGCR